MEKQKSVVLLSGGMDSCVCLGIAIENSSEVAALHLNYGHRTEEKELNSFNEICNHYNIKKRLVVNVNHLSEIGGSSLTDENMQVELADLDSTEIPTSYVPFRNANILSIATSWTEVLNFDSIYIGAVSEDSAGYPDCRKEFYEAFEKAIDLGTKPSTKIKIYTPIIDMSKKEIVEKGLEINSPLNLTWSCYSSNSEACGVCDSCVRRLRGFEEAGSKDLIVYSTNGK